MWTNSAAPSEWVSGLPVLTACKIGGKSSSSSDIDRAVCEMVGGGESFYSVDESALRRLSPDVAIETRPQANPTGALRPSSTSPGGVRPNHDKRDTRRPISKTSQRGALNPMLPNGPLRMAARLLYGSPEAAS